MEDDLQCDAFLSLSLRNEEVEHDASGRLIPDSRRFLFDLREIQPGKHIPAEMEDGLEHSTWAGALHVVAFGVD
ncbi:MAG: hypothetical protein K0U98_16345 [Deltaproteobacteria bacterium]|nr:hypothetical protein [Deltaproteobacteria bacterium]